MTDVLTGRTRCPPPAMSQAFSVGRLIEVDGATHFDLIDPLSTAWPTVIGAIGQGAS